MSDKGLEGLLREWREYGKLDSTFANEVQPSVDRLKDVESKLRDDAHEMASPFYSKTPTEPDWSYVANGM